MCSLGAIGPASKGYLRVVVGTLGLVLAFGCGRAHERYYTIASMQSITFHDDALSHGSLKLGEHSNST